MKEYWGGLLNVKRFEKAKKEKLLWLKNLSNKKALELEESLIASRFIWKLRKNFVQDIPVCLNQSLKNQKNASGRSL